MVALAWILIAAVAIVLLACFSAEARHDSFRGKAEGRLGALVLLLPLSLALAIVVLAHG